MDGIFHRSRHGRIRKDRERAHYALVRKYSLLLYPRWLTMTISGVEVGIKWRPDPSELVELGPEFKEIWDSFYANAPDKSVLWTGIFSACLANNRNLLPQRKYFTMGTRTVSTMVPAMPVKSHQI